LFADIKFQFHNSGHILGSAMVELHIVKDRFLFTGDLGRTTPILMQGKSTVESTDYLILESTYGDRMHSAENASEVLHEHIKQTIQRGGQLLIPSFAIERTQEILRLLVDIQSNGHSIDIPIYLDSPMASAASDVYMAYKSWMSTSGEQFLKAFSFVQVISDFRQTLRLAKDNRPKIIIAGSGMLEGGRMLYYLSKQLQKRNNTLLFVGFQAEGTLGRKLVNGAKKVELFNQSIDVKCSVHHINALSAHADFSEITEWLNGFTKAPKEVFLNHGEPSAMLAFKNHIEKTLNWGVSIPELGQAFLLNHS
jgi:metallo-beta-lactamase family protein